MRIDLVDPDLAGQIQHRKADRTDPAVEFCDAGAARDLGTHLLDQALADLEVVLPEGPRRVMHRRSAETLADAGRPVPVLEPGTQDRVRAPGVRVEPETVQIAAKPL